MVVRMFLDSHILSNCRQQFTLICFCSCVNKCGTQRAHTFLMFSLLCKILCTVVSLSFTALAISATIIFLSISMIFFTFAAFSSLHSEDGFPDIGRSATFERPHLNCLHQVFTKENEGQES